MLRSLLIILVLIAINISSRAQTPAIDSTFKAILKSTSDNEKIVSGARIIDNLTRQNQPRADSLATIFENIEKTIDDTLYGHLHSSLGRYYASKIWYSKSIIEYDKALAYHEIKKDTYHLAVTHLVKGTSYRHLGNHEKAIDEFLKASKYAIEIKHTGIMAGCFNNLGIVYYFNDQQEKSETYFKRALEIFEAEGNDLNLAKINNNIGIIYKNDEDYDKAIEYFDESYRRFEQLGIRQAYGTVFHNLGYAYLRKGMIDIGYSYLNKSVDVKKEFNDEEGLAETYSVLAEFKLDDDDLAAANKYATKAMVLANKHELAQMIANTNLIFAGIYKAEGNYELAFNFYEKSVKGMDSIRLASSSKTIETVESQFALEKAQMEAIKEKQQHEISEAKLANQEIENQRQSDLLKLSVLAGVLFIILSIFIFRAYRLKRKSNDELQIQHQIIAEKNKEITDSIVYAKRLQDSFIPSNDEFTQLFSESFVLFKPKDIVSGDFYWLEQIDNKIIFAAADCTGHGVPGAMVSVVCSNALQKAVSEIHDFDPGKILDLTRNIVIDHFSRSNQVVRDGMDISLVVWDKGSNEIQWAGANNPLWHIKNDSEKPELIEFKADKQPIGDYGNAFPFTTNKLEFETGDSIYLFSDGYADQFGGDLGKKMKTARFKELVLGIQNKSMAEQGTILSEEFDKWKGDLEQIDDVCVIGIRK